MLASADSQRLVYRYAAGSKRSRLAAGANASSSQLRLQHTTLVIYAGTWLTRIAGVIKTAAQVSLVSVESPTEVSLTTATAVIKVLCLATASHGASGLVFDLDEQNTIITANKVCDLVYPKQYLSAQVAPVVYTHIVHGA